MSSRINNSQKRPVFLKISSKKPLILFGLSKGSNRAIFQQEFLISFNHRFPFSFCLEFIPKMNSAYVHQHYRNTTIGTTLQSSLDDMMERGDISKDLLDRVMLEFDRQINHELRVKLKNKFVLKGQLQTYRYCDGVWILIMKHAEFKDIGETIRSENIKVIACEAPKQPKGGSSAANENYYD